MQRRNFDNLMQEQIKQAQGKSLLLHCCCAPCSSSCLERLKDYLKITVLFYNPNIEDGEYERRKNELIRFISETGWADFIDCDHNTREFYSAAKGFEFEKEGGARCVKCFELRLSKTAELANKHGYDYFATTLTVSPLKNATVINEIGEMLGGDKWLYSDFKKKNGFLRSTELSEKHKLYRQNYCGCEFSKRGEHKTD